MTQTAESIEAESAIVRSQLVEVGADIRHRADPTAIVDAAKASFQRRIEEAPQFLKQNASPIGMVVLGGALGAALTGYLSTSRRSASTASRIATSSPGIQVRASSTKRPQLKAALLSGAGVGLGYLAGMFIPATPAEERLLDQPKAVLRQHLDDFLKENSRGMKMAVANVFGVSRLSAVALVGLAMVAELMATPRPRGKPTSP